MKTEQKCSREQKQRHYRLLAVLFVLLLPAFVVAVFARPTADDYTYGMQVYQTLQGGGNLFDVLGAALRTDVYYFNNWQGLYSSGFLLALVPSVFGERWYGLTFFIVAGLLFVCLWAMLRPICKKLLPQVWGLPSAGAAVLCFAIVQGMPNPVEGLFWFNGAMNYLPYVALSLLNVGLMVRLACLPKETTTTGKKVLLVLAASLVSVVISGGHQVPALLNLMLLFAALVLAGLHKHFYPLAPLFAGAAGLLVNLTAPGTRVRVSGFGNTGILEAAVKSFILAALEWIRWLDVPLLCLLALSTPLLLAAVKQFGKENMPVAFRKPWLAFGYTFLMMWAMIFLPSYSMGGIGPGRLINVVWIAFVLGLLCSYGCLLGWLIWVKKLSLDLPRISARRCSVAVLALLACMACIGPHTVKEGLDNHFATSLEALYELGEGKPQRFAAAADARVAALKSEADQTVEIATLTEEERPYLLFFTDITSEGGAAAVGAYYGKDVVVKQ